MAQDIAISTLLIKVSLYIKGYKLTLSEYSGETPGFGGPSEKEQADYVRSMLVIVLRSFQIY